MNKIHEFQEVHRYIKKLEIMQRWMNNDLKNSSINGHANLLVAMGLFNYIEILGGFYKFSGSRQRFNFVINQLLPKEYKNVCKRIDKLTIKDSYDVLRCGMTHEYLIKMGSLKDKNKTFRFTIYGVENDEQYDMTVRQRSCGLELIRSKDNPNYYHLYVFNARFINDLNLAFNNFKLKLNSDVKGYRKAFLNRVHETGLNLLM